MEQAGNAAAALPAPAGGGQGARAADAVFTPDYQLSSVLKKGSCIRKHGWEKEFEKDLERYKIPHEERTRFKTLPPECISDNVVITGTNTEVMQLYDAAGVTRCEVLILKAKGKLKADRLKQESEYIRNLLLYAKPKRKLILDAGGTPFPFPAHFVNRLVA